MTIAYYLPFITLDAQSNMAIDEYLYKYVDNPVLRFYNFNELSLTIGYNQRYERSCDTSYVEENNIPVVRRITGGRTVPHCGDLTYSFSSVYTDFNSIIEENTLKARYSKLAEGFIAGFENADIDVEVNRGESEQPYGANCFDSTSIYEITVKGRKVLGSAQTFMQDRFMQQGSILVNNCANASAVFGGRVELYNIEKVTDMAYNIKDLADEFYSEFIERMAFEWKEFNFDFNESRYNQLLDKYKSDEHLRRR